MPDNSVVDSILRSHYRRLQEASALCEQSVFFPAKRPPPHSVQGVSSTQRLSQSVSTVDAEKTGIYRAAMKLYKRTGSFSAVSESLNIPESTVRLAKKREDETGSPQPGKRGRKVGTATVCTPELLLELQNFIDLNPSTTLKAMREHLAACNPPFEYVPDVTTISKVLKNMKITNKTIVKVPKDRNSPVNCQKRIEWAITWRYLERAGAVFVYIDEAGFNLHNASGKGWAVVGFTPEVEVPSNKEQNVSLLAALIPGRKVEFYQIKKGSFTSDIIVEWLTRNLIPLCKRVYGTRPVVFVTDNAQCRGNAVEECIVINGYRFLKTVPYSPQMNPIERIFSQVKSYVSRRTRSDGRELVRQIVQGLESITEEQSTNYLMAHLQVLEDVQRGFKLGSYHIFSEVNE